MSDEQVGPNTDGKPDRGKVGETIERLLDMNEIDAALWLGENMSQFNDAELASIIGFLEPKNAIDITYLAGNEFGFNERWINIDRSMKLTAAEVQNFLDGKTSAQVRQEELKEQGASQQQAEQQAQAEGFDVSLTPEVVLAYTGNRRPSISQQRALVDSWNEFADTPVNSYAELERVLQYATDPFVESIVDNAFNGSTPITNYTFKIGPSARRTPSIRQAEHGGFGEARDVMIEAYQVEGMRQTPQFLNFDNRDLKTMVTYADRYGVTDSIGQNGWQVVAGIAAQMGYFDLAERNTQDLDPKKAGAGQMPGGAAAMMSIAKKRDATVARKLGQKLVAYNQGLKVYGGNQSMAFLHSVDPRLAATIANTKPENLDPVSANRASQYMLKAGWSQEQLRAMGFDALGIADFTEFKYRTNSGAGGYTRTLPDPVAVKQSARDMYVTLFAKEPTEAELQALVGVVNQSIASAPENQNIDVAAQLQNSLESNGQYKELYGHKPGGMDNLDYQNQFRAGAASILGNTAADPDVIRSGMRDGQYQTAVGAAAVSKQAFDNSTWLGRLANAARVVAENT